jgi:thioredoxin reductase
VELKNGNRYKLNAVFSRTPIRQHCTIPEQLGCGLNEQGLLITDEFQRTNVPGIFVAGDNSTVFRSVIIAAAAGTKAAAFLNKELIEEEF